MKSWRPRAGFMDLPQHLLSVGVAGSARAVDYLQSLAELLPFITPQGDCVGVIDTGQRDVTEQEETRNTNLLKMVTRASPARWRLDRQPRGFRCLATPLALRLSQIRPRTERTTTTITTAPTI